MVISQSHKLVVGVLLIAVIIFIVAMSFNNLPEYIEECLCEGEKATRLKGLESNGIKEVYIIEDEGGKPIRMLQIVEEQGYNEMIRIRVHVEYEQNEVMDVSILAHHETDNYGGYAAEDWFLERFAGKDASLQLQMVKLAAVNPEDIVYVTGATVTSQAVVTGVNKALAVYQDYSRGEVH